MIPTNTTLKSQSSKADCKANCSLSALRKFSKNNKKFEEKDKSKMCKILSGIADAESQATIT